MTGPISLMTDSASMDGRKLSAPNRASVPRLCMASTIPIEKPTTPVSVRLLAPTSSICASSSLTSNGRRQNREKKRPANSNSRPASLRNPSAALACWRSRTAASCWTTFCSISFSWRIFSLRRARRPARRRCVSESAGESAGLGAARGGAGGRASMTEGSRAGRAQEARWAAPPPPRRGGARRGASGGPLPRDLGLATGLDAGLVAPRPPGARASG